MAKIRFIDKKFSKKHRKVVLQANSIIKDYQRQGFRLTLRQLYYQILSKGWMDDWWKNPDLANSKQSYNLLKNVVSAGRRAGLIDWDAIEDRERSLMGINTVSGPREAIAKVHSTYALDLWANQPYRPEVWVEKKAQVSVIARICNELRVDYFACKGYNSDSEAFRAGERFHRYVMAGQAPIVFYMGDHDPSGIDMVRDHRERLAMFAGTPINVVRLGLNMDQVRKYSPPPNYAKVTDVRYESYKEQFGVEECWEMDALSPDVIMQLVRDAVDKVRDEKLWSEALNEEVEDKVFLEEVARGTDHGDDD